MTPHDHEADEHLAVDVVAGVAEQARELQHAGGEDHRRGEQEREAGRVLVVESPRQRPPTIVTPERLMPGEQREDLQQADDRGRRGS